MKRSEMLNIIDDVIEESRSFVHGEVTTSQLDEKILAAIEKAGMKPPERMYEFSYNNEPVTVSSLSWEPE